MYCSWATCRFKQCNCFQLRFTRGNRTEQLLLRQPYTVPRPLTRLGDLSAKPRASHLLSLNCTVVQSETVNTAHSAHFPHSCSAGLSPQTAGLPRLATGRPSIPQLVVLPAGPSPPSNTTASGHQPPRSPCPWQSAGCNLGLYQGSAVGEIDRTHAPLRQAGGQGAVVSTKRRLEHRRAREAGSELRSEENTSRLLLPLLWSEKLRPPLPRKPKI